MFGMSPLELSAALAAVVAGRPPFSLLAAAAPGAMGPTRDTKQVDPGHRQHVWRGLQATPDANQKFWVPDRTLEAGLGSKMAISPDGTHLVARDKNNGHGGAHLFKKDASSGQWVWQSRHYSSVQGYHSGLGQTAIAMTDDWFFLGANASSVRSRQMVLGYKRNADGSWPATETVKLNLPSGEATSTTHGDEFGSGISVDGDTLLVGAHNHSPSGCKYCGAAYVYERDGDNWVYVKKLSPDPSALPSSFGDHSMVVRGDEILIGSGFNGRLPQFSSGQGRVYIFKKTAIGWPETATATIEPPEGANFFGFSISLSTDGNLLGVGAQGDGGRVYLFERGLDGSWPNVHKQEISTGDGRGVFLQGNAMALSSYNDRSVYVYHSSQDGTFPDTATYRLQATDNPSSSSFGAIIVVGADGQVMVADENQPARNSGMNGCVSGNGACGAIYAFDNPAFEAIGPWAFTETPTASPTQAPTVPGPIDALNLTAVTKDFLTKSAVSLVYDVGVGRAFQYGLYKKGCDVAVNDTSLVDESHEVQSIDDSVQELTLTYDFNLTAVENSDIWNSSSSTLEVCSKVDIVVGDFPVFFAEQEISIEIDLEADFNLNVSLEEALTKSANDTVDFQNAIRGFKCNTGTFTLDTTELAPNEELEICIESTDTSVLIEELVTMKSQQGEGDEVLIVSGGSAEVAAITSIVPPRGPVRQMAVTTRLPLNKFTFAVDEELTVSGSVLLQFASRRLQSERKLRNLQDSVTDAEPQEAAFQVKVGLKPKNGIGDEVPMGSSAGYATSKYAAAFALISMVILNLM